MSTLKVFIYFIVTKIIYNQSYADVSFRVLCVIPVLGDPKQQQHKINETLGLRLKSKLTLPTSLS